MLFLNPQKPIEPLLKQNFLANSPCYFIYVSLSNGDNLLDIILKDAVKTLEVGLETSKDCISRPGRDHFIKVSRLEVVVFMSLRLSLMFFVFLA